jgi:hypothetical protein
VPPSRQSRDSPVIAPQWPPRSIDPARQHGSTESSHGGIAPRSRTMSLCRYSRTASTVYTVTNSFCDSWCKTRNSLNSIRHQAAVLGASPFFLSPVHQRRQGWLLDNFQASISCEVAEFRRAECFHPGEDYARAVLCARLLPELSPRCLNSAKDDAVPHGCVLKRLSVPMPNPISRLL